MHTTECKSSGTLVIGAGELGIAMLRGLTKHRAATGNGAIHVLLRPVRDQNPRDAQHDVAGRLQEMGAEIVRADLAASTVEQLATLFARYGTVICCTGFVGGMGTQRKITAAVLKAGVNRYVPWQFGVDYDAVGRDSGQPVWDEQLDVRDMLRAQSRTHWTIVSTGMFTSFLFEPAFGLVDFSPPRVNALGRWDYRLTVTTPEDIGDMTAAILAQAPRMDDTVVYIAGDTLSYEQLADRVEQFLNRPVERVLWSVPMLRQRAVEHPDDTMRKYHLAFARDSGVAWDKSQTFNAAEGITLTDVPTWLKARHPSKTNSVGAAQAATCNYTPITKVST